MMNTLTILPPIQRANESLAKLVATAREKFAAEFQDETAEFDASSWDISNLKERSTNPASRRIHFTRRDTTDQALPPLYANVLKSWVILDRRVAETMARRDRLPSDAALNGLADVYRQHAKEPRDRLRAAALAILVVTGLRVSELLTLPIDCEVEEVRAARPRYGLRYYKEKARGAERMFAVRWLTPTGAELD